MIAKGFVPYRQYWVLRELQERLLRELPALRVRNGHTDPVAILIDETLAERVEGGGNQIVALPTGQHRVKFAMGRRQSLVYSVELRRGYDGYMALLEADQAPSVKPILPKGESGKKDGTIVTSDFTVRIANNQIVGAVLRKVHTAEGNVIVGPRGAPIDFNPTTWRLRTGYLFGGDVSALCVSDDLGAYFLNDPRSDKALYEHAFMLLSPDELPHVAEALERVGKLGDASLARYVPRFLGNPDGVIRTKAAEAIALLGDKTYIEVLRKAELAERDNTVKSAIGNAIGRLERKGEVPALIQSFGKSDDREKLEVLGKLRERAADVPISFFKEVVEKSESAALREVAVRALGEGGSEDAGPVLLKALSDKEASVRRYALEGLARLQLYEALGAIEGCLSDKDAEVRAAAASALGELGVANVIPRLLGRLNDEDKWASYEACSALQRISGKALRFEPGAEEKQRKDVIEQWKSWWEK
jgi:HEAT repeat protein